MPIIVGLECTLQVGLDIYVKGLWFKLREWWIIDARNSFSGRQVMEIWSEFVEFCPCRLLLQFGLLEGSFSGKIFKLLPYFLVLGLDVLEIALPSIEIMLVFPRVISSVIFLNYFCLFIEKFTLFIFVFILLLMHELATANIASPDSLNFLGCTFLIIKLPLNLEHSPIFLDYYSSSVFLVSEFLSFVQHSVVGVYHVFMTIGPLF